MWSMWRFFIKYKNHVYVILIFPSVVIHSKSNNCGLKLMGGYLWVCVSVYWKAPCKELGGQFGTSAIQHHHHHHHPRGAKVVKHLERWINLDTRHKLRRWPRRHSDQHPGDLDQKEGWKCELGQLGRLCDRCEGHWGFEEGRKDMVGSA